MNGCLSELWSEPQPRQLVSSCLQSFFDGWDCTKKKDKTKGRHDTLLGCESFGRALSRRFKSLPFPKAPFSSCVSDDRHRVKLHPLLGDPNSDYINANYIDVSPSRRFPLPPLSLTHVTQSSSPSHPPELTSAGSLSPGAFHPIRKQKHSPPPWWSPSCPVVSPNLRGIDAFKSPSTKAPQQTRCDVTQEQAPASAALIRVLLSTG